MHGPDLLLTNSRNWVWRIRFPPLETAPSCSAQTVGKWGRESVAISAQVDSVGAAHLPAVELTDENDSCGSAKGQMIPK